MKTWKNVGIFSATALCAVQALSLLITTSVVEAQNNNRQFKVSTVADTVDVTPGDGRCADVNGDCSLRAAIQEANSLQGPKRTIVLAKRATYTLTLDGANEDLAVTGDLDVFSNLLIKGNGATINAAGLDRAFDQISGDLTVENLVVTNGSVTDSSGGAYRTKGKFTLKNSTVTTSNATGSGASGGAIFNDGGTIRVERSKFNSNSATRAGGAIESNAGQTKIVRSDFASNSTGPTPGNGGAFHLTGLGTVKIDNSKFNLNVATSEGGGVWNSSEGNMSIKGSNFTNNGATGSSSDEGGGAIFNNGGVMKVTRAKVSSNTASVGSGSGGGLFNNGGSVVIDRSDFRNNSASRAGGGIEALAGTTTIRKGKLNGNTTGNSPGNGGGLHLTGAGTVVVNGLVATSNTASAEGGALWNSATGTMNITGAKIRNNRASGNDPDQGGGGLFNDGGVMTVKKTELTKNSANGVSGSGGGILNNQGTLNISGSPLNGNSATRAGGGIEANIGTTVLSKVVLSKNTTGANPGNGGGLHLTGAGQVTITRSEARSNTASAEGGGFWNSSSGTMTATNSKTIKNKAPLGSDVFNDGGTFTFNGQTVVPTP